MKKAEAEPQPQPIELFVVGDNSCKKDADFTATVIVRGNKRSTGPITYKITLFEDDVLTKDDEIGSKEITSPPGPGKWSMRVPFTFRPSKFEHDKDLDLYAVGGPIRAGSITLPEPTKDHGTLSEKKTVKCQAK